MLPIHFLHCYSISRKTSYPGQEHVAGNSKIPSILYYDRGGNVVAVGAEAETTQIMSQAEDEEWTKVELYVVQVLLAERY